MKLKTLKPRLSTAPARLKLSPENPNATPRMRGGSWMRRRAAWLSAHPLCVHCQESGRAEVATQVDHVIPLWKGGDDDESNYQSLCEPCHQEKTSIEAAQRASCGGGVYA